MSDNLPQPAEEQKQESFMEKALGMFIRMVVIFWVVNTILKFTQPQLAVQNAPTEAVSATQAVNGGSICLWPIGTEMKLFVCVSEQMNKCDPKGVVFKADMKLGDWSDAAYLSKDLVIPASKEVQNNGSLYSHIFVTRNKATPSDVGVKLDDVFYQRFDLVRYLKKVTAKNTKSLLGDEKDQNEDKKEISNVSVNDKDEIVSYWYPNLTIHFVPEATVLPVEQLSQMPFILKHIQFAPHTKTQRSHYPLMFVNEFWTFHEDLTSFPINSTVTELPVHLHITPFSIWKFQMMMQMENSFKVQRDMMGISETEIDQLKRMFFETSPWLLAVTFIVSLLHSLFDFLAFKNDVQFWRERKNMEGLSLRAILLNIGFQAIIFLYLLDNETSWLIVISSGVGLAIEIWKIQRAVKISVEKGPWLMVLPFKIAISDRNLKSELGKETDEYDRIAFKYLGIAAFPLVIGYSIYSLVYEKHKSWYSWLINTAVGFVYTFGFITMTPQLFINYKLKSVSHMPWKTFMYKALNTFVDDLFSFVIRMPTLHRLACFRDDIVFFIYLYQRWVYPVDKTRPNEYGQVGVDDKAAEGEAAEVEADSETKKTQ